MSNLYTIDKLKKHFEVTAEELLPSQSGNSGKFLATDGSDIEWASVDALPSQSGNSGKYLTTNGETASWSEVDSLPSQSGNSGKYLTTNGTTASWGTIESYVLPTAASDTLGGVKVGTNLSIDSSTGVLSATDTVTTVTVTGEGNAITNITDSNGALTATKGSTFSLSNHTHDNVYAPLASPTFTGTPTAPTADAGTNTTQIATTAFVNTAVSSLVSSAPETLDTLNELAAALGNDPNFATTIASDIGSKLDSNSANYVKGLSISGTTITVTAGDNSTSTLTTQDTTYTLPEATTSTLGGVIVGDGLNVSNGTISVDDQLPTQTGNSGKFLTTDGTDASWSDILNETKISSVHYPTANAATIVLTQEQAIPSTVNKYAMSVYRDGIYLNPSIDYGYNSSTRTLTFTKSFEADEIVTVIFNYIDNDSQVTVDLGVDEYEAGTGVTFTNNAVTNKVVINADDQLPTQTGQSGKFLTTDGTDISWANVDALPSQTGNSGKYLTTNGSAASWTSLSEYTLPKASASDLGGIKVGTNLSIDSDGVLSATDTTYEVVSTTSNGLAPQLEGSTTKYLRADGSWAVPPNDNTITTATTTGDGNAVTSVTATDGALTVTKGETFSLSNHTHDNVYAPLASPAFTGTPTAPTASAGTNSTQVATTAYVDNAVSSLVNSAPTTLDTLNELAAALGNDPNFATTISTEIGEKLDADSSGYVKSLAISGTTVTVTKGDDTTSTLTIQDTTYSAGDGLTLTGTTFSADDQLPSQTGNAGKFLTTDGTDASWSDILNETKISSVHYPTANATTVVLTQAQAIPSNTNKYAMSVYRNGIYLNSGIDYGYNNSTRTLTFTDAFEDDEIVTVVFTYLDTDSQVTLDIDVDEYEAGTGITFTNNAVTNKVVINADDQLPSQTNNSGKFLTTNGSTVSWETVGALPDQTNNSGKYLTTNGTNASWAAVDTFPSQSGNSGKFLTTNGSAVSWATVDALPSQTGNSGKFLTTDGTAASWDSPFSLVREFNTTAGQNTLTLPSDFLTLNQYDAMVVFLDGIRLVKNVDYTFDSSTRVLTFVDTFISGDTVTVGLYANNYEALSSGEFPALSSGILTSDGNSMSWKNFTKMVYTQDITSANETVTIPQANLTDAVVTDVFRNGLLLVESDDYTIDSSTREIIFVVPLAANEKIVVVTQNAVLNSSTLISGANIQNSTATTPIAGDNSNNIATTAFVNNALSSVDLSNYVTSSGLTTTLNNYVDLSSDQTITGKKTFSNNNLTLTVSAKDSARDLKFLGTDKSAVLTLRAIDSTDGSHTMQLFASNVINNTDKYSTLFLSVDSSGNKRAYLSQSPSTASNSSDIATTAYVNNKFANPIEKVNTITSAASITIDPSAGSLFTLSLSTNASITLDNVSNGPYTTNGQTLTLYLSNTSNTITWDSKITWMSGEAPDVTSNPSIITFVTFNGGTNWYGSSIEVKSSS